LPLRERIAFLVRLNTASEQVRGLERHICKKHKVQRQCLKRGSIRAVLDLQKQYRDQQKIIVDGESAEELAVKLREISELHSRTARVYARLLGLADEQVLQDERAAETQRQPRSKSDSGALVRTGGAGDRLAQMQMQQSTTKTTKGQQGQSQRQTQTTMPIALPPPVKDCDRHQTVSNAA
jgi:uncharacterized protein YicC (UPF0701 family)